jgi:hypothetical protein
MSIEHFSKNFWKVLMDIQGNVIYFCIKLITSHKLHSVGAATRLLPAGWTTNYRDEGSFCV